MIQTSNRKSYFCHRIYVLEYAFPRNEEVSSKVVTTRNGIEKDNRIIKELKISKKTSWIKYSLS